MSVAPNRASVRCERRPLLVEVVFGLFAIEFEQRLAGRHAVAKVGGQPADAALGLGRHGDLVDRRQRADHFDGAAEGLLANLLDLDRLGLLRAAARLDRVRPGAARRRREEGDDRRQLRDTTPKAEEHRTSLHADARE